MLFDVKTQDDFEPEIPRATVAKHGRIWLITRPSIRRWAQLVARRTDTPSGDFVDDLVGDRAFGDFDPRSWPELRGYLEWHACRDAIRAGREVWRRYASFCQRHGFDLEAAQ